MLVKQQSFHSGTQSTINQPSNGNYQPKQAASSGQSIERIPTKAKGTKRKYSLTDVLDEITQDTGDCAGTTMAVIKETPKPKTRKLAPTPGSLLEGLERNDIKDGKKIDPAPSSSSKTEGNPKSNSKEMESLFSNYL